MAINLSISNRRKAGYLAALKKYKVADPPLSTIIQPAYDIGREAANILFKIIEKKMLMPYEKKMVLPSQLIERASTAVK